MTVTAFPLSVPATMTKAEEQRAWIGKLLDHFRLNQTQLSAQAKIDPSTLSKFMAGARSGHVLSTATIDRIERKFGVRFPDDPRGVAPNGLAEPEAELYDVRTPPTDAAAIAARALCAGYNSRVPWVLRSRVLEEVGLLPGDLLVVDLNEQPADGDVVCAQAYDRNGRAETVFRIFKQPVFLVGAGPGARLPLMADNRAAQIRGVVIGSFRPRGISGAVA